MKDAVKQSVNSGHSSHKGWLMGPCGEEMETVVTSDLG